MPAPSRHLKLLGAVALAALVVLLLASCGGTKHKRVATVVTTVTTTAKPPPPPPQRPSMITIFGDPARLASDPGAATDASSVARARAVVTTLPDC